MDEWMTAYKELKVRLNFFPGNFYSILFAIKINLEI